MQCRRPGFNPWIRKIPWRREWQPTPVFLAGESHGQRSLAGYSPWGCRVRHDWVTKHTHTEENEESRGILLEISYFIEESYRMKRENKNKGNVYLVFLHILLCVLLVTSANYLQSSILHSSNITCISLYFYNWFWCYSISYVLLYLLLSTSSLEKVKKGILALKNPTSNRI